MSKQLSAQERDFKSQGEMAEEMVKAAHPSFDTIILSFYGACEVIVDIKDTLGEWFRYAFNPEEA